MPVFLGDPATGRRGVACDVLVLPLLEDDALSLSLLLEDELLLPLGFPLRAGNLVEFLP